MFKTIIRIIVLVVIVLISFHFIANFSIDYFGLKGKLEKKVSEKIGFRFQAEDLDFDFYRGFSFENIFIKGNRSGYPFELKIDHVFVDITFSKLLFRKIEVEELKASQILCFVEKKEIALQIPQQEPKVISEQQVVLEKTKPQEKKVSIKRKKKKRKFVFSIKKIRIENLYVQIPYYPSTIELSDLSIDLKAQDDYQSVFCSVRFNKPLRSQFSLYFQSYGKVRAKFAVLLGPLQIFGEVQRKDRWEMPYCVIRNHKTNLILHGFWSERERQYELTGDLNGNLKEIIKTVSFFLPRKTFNHIYDGLIDLKFLLKGMDYSLRSLIADFSVVGKNIQIGNLSGLFFKQEAILRKGLLFSSKVQLLYEQGSVETMFWADLDRLKTYGLDLSMQHLEIGPILSLFYSTDDPLRVRLSGNLIATGSELDFEKIVGLVELQLSAEKLWKMEFLGNLFGFLNPLIPGEIIFDSCQASLAFYQGWAWIRKMVLSSPSIALETVGKIKLGTGEVDMILRVAPGKGGAKYLLTKALAIGFKLIGEELVDFRISENIQKPQFKRIYLPKGTPLETLLLSPFKFLLSDKEKS